MIAEDYELTKFIETHEIEGKTNKGVYSEYVAKSDNPMGFRTFMYRLTREYGFTTKQRCTGNGMIRIIVKSEMPDGLDNFIGERGPEMFEGQVTSEVYSQYVDECEKPIGRIEFSRRLCARLGLRTKSAYVNGLYVRIYARNGE